MKKFGLFIGIDRYRDFPPEHHLRCAGADARALAKLFEDQLGFVTKALCDTDLGFDGNGNHELIFEQLQSWKAQLAAHEESLLLVYFAGHGTVAGGQQYLLAPKAPFSALEEPEHADVGVISEARLRRASARWPNAQRVLVFDACRTPLQAGSGAQVAERGLAFAGPRYVFQPEPGLAVLCACAPNQVAFELHQFGAEKRSHGLYTAALLAVLQQKASNDETLALDEELNQHVGRTMRALAKQHAPAEHKARVEQQQPLRQGEVICLVDGAELALRKTRQQIGLLLQDFEQHFAAGRFYRPAVQSCSHSLWQLQALGYAPGSVLQLSARLEAADGVRREAERDAQTAALLATLEQRMLQVTEQRSAAQELAQAQEEKARLERGMVASTARIAELEQALQQAVQEKQQAVQEKQQAVQEKQQAVQEKQQVAQEKQQAMEEKQQAMQVARQAIQEKQQALDGLHALSALQKVASAEETISPAQPVASAPKAVGVVFQDHLQDGSKGPLMVVVPPGRFQIGSKLRENEKNGPVVNIAKPFAVGKYPITVAQYLAAVKAGQCREPEWREEGSRYHYQTGSNDQYRKMGQALLGEHFPIVGISWEDAKTWLQWINAARQDKYGAYRLLSEAEWEYCARADTNGRWYHGDDEARLTDHAWYEKNSDGHTHAVGEKAANAFGLHDMHGNVWEWGEDGWHKDYLGAPDDGSVWVADSDEEQRMLRGGSWNSTPANLRSAYRGTIRPTIRSDFIGFRVARTLP